MSFLGFAVLMAPVWLAVIAVEYVGHRLFFARDLARTPRRRPAHARTSPLPVVPLVVVGADARRLRGAARRSACSRPGSRGPRPWCSVVYALSGGGWTPRTVARADARLSFAIFVLCLGVVVAGLSDTFLGDLVALAACRTGPGSASLLVVALLATVLANLVNNLPATLLLVPLVAPLGVTAVLAALVGLGVGSNLTYTGSLANLLWRRTLARSGPPSTRTFHALGALITLPTVVVGTVVLWAWAPLVG